MAASNATNSGRRRRLLAASASPQMVTVYYDLAGVPQGQASSAPNTLNSDTSALVAAANKQGAMPTGGAGYGLWSTALVMCMRQAAARLHAVTLKANRGYEAMPCSVIKWGTAAAHCLRNCVSACACAIAGLTVTSIVLVQVQTGGITVPALEVRPAMARITPHAHIDPMYFYVTGMTLTSPEHEISFDGHDHMCRLSMRAVLVRGLQAPQSPG